MMRRRNSMRKEAIAVIWMEGEAKDAEILVLLEDQLEPELQDTIENSVSNSF